MESILLSREVLEGEGWKHSMTYDRHECYEGASETKIEFTKGDIWKEGGYGAFLTFYPERSVIRIASTDAGTNIDGPNCSEKLNVVCKDLETFKYLLSLIPNLNL